MKVLLVVLDGWGYRDEREGNAVRLARTPNFDRIWRKYPHTLLNASGKSVGLPGRTMGGSEVGHLHMGAGRIVKQKLTLINESIADGGLCRKKYVKEAFSRCKKSGTLHLMGLMSDAGVHSNMKHLFELLKGADEAGLQKVWLHCFLDGRDTPPKSAVKYLELLEKRMKENTGKIATVSGRYYSMDRDKRWERTGRAYEAIAMARGPKENTWRKAVKEAYKRGETDEFVAPTVIRGYHGIKKDDAVILFNFRPDRMVQLAKLLLKTNRNVVSMARYSKDLRTKVLFPPNYVRGSLGEILSRKGMKQLRIAESEKGPHVTYFFNGMNERPFRGEERFIVASPKIPTYDLKPEMSAPEITKKLLVELKKKYDFILVNFANGDMVGHTGVLPAGIKAAEAVDSCLGQILKAARSYAVIVTADHGNLEDMRGESVTAHTLNKVPFILVSNKYRGKKLRGGGLSNIAPTILEIMGIRHPNFMVRGLL